MGSGQSKLLVRADSGPAVGTGSVMRTLALANVWKHRGGTATFVCGDLPHGLIKRIESDGFTVVQIQNSSCDGADAKDTSEIATVVQPDWIVLDGNRFNDAYQRALRRSDSKLLVIDSAGTASHPYADLILNQNIFATRSMYPASCRGRVLVGPQFVLLRATPASQTRVTRESKRIPSEARRILVNFNGTDQENWTLRSLQILADLDRKRLAIDCFVSPRHAHREALQKFKRSGRTNLRIHRHLDRLTLLVSNFDLAITDGNSHCDELFHRGIPTLVASVKGDQQVVARKLNRRGIMVSVQRDSDTPDGSPSAYGKRLEDAIRSLITDSQKRKSLSESGRRLVDGNGAHRLARSLEAGIFTIRRANVEDIDTVWRWQNDPEVRSVSFDTRPIPLGPFSKTFRKQLTDPHTQIWIAESVNGQALGVIRFDSNDSQTPHTVRVVIDQARRGRGLGTLLIARACHEFFRDSNTERLIAQIKPGNIASEKAFRAAGFVGIEPAVIKGIMVSQFQLNRGIDMITSRPLVRARKSA